MTPDEHEHSHEHGHSHDHGQESRPSASKALENWLQPIPLGRKLRLGVRNISRRFTRRQTCCDAPGQPGC